MLKFAKFSQNAAEADGIACIWSHAILLDQLMKNGEKNEGINNSVNI